MNNKRFFLVFLFYLFCDSLKPQDFILTADTTPVHSADSIIIRPKRPWKAALETVGFNLALGTFDRYVLKGDYAQISFSSIKKNFQTGFVWDNDKFATNMFGHPYEGGIYFSAARTNGLNFYESMPYALGGSLMWEFCMETDPPAINDLITTTVGGFSLGETTGQSENPVAVTDLVV
ncbi:MAG: DUF3943 domain-containing protein [Tannerella sp.]|jgi:hypothetical protein|nr:DUF3943 domain-containing protein [Tannerella sp.]